MWRPLARLILQGFSGMGLQEAVFLMDFKTVRFHNLSVFISAYGLWRRRVEHSSLFWQLREPAHQEGLLSALCWAGPAVTEAFSRAGISKLGAVLEYTGPGLQEARRLVAALAWRSERAVGRLLEHWRSYLTGQEFHLLLQSCCWLDLPPLSPTPALGGAAPEPEKGQEAIVCSDGQVFEQHKLQQQTNLCWRTHLALEEQDHPQWGSLYKAPL